jgi:hypothetical protein
MKLKNTFTILRSNTGWQRKKGIHPLALVLGFIIVILMLYLVHEVLTSQFLSRRDRITIGVYDDVPYVFSYDKTTRLGTVIYFNSDVMVTVPGGYGWYRLGSVRLLATIEHKTNALLTQTFAQLIGAPVDLAIYRTTKDLIDNKVSDFMEYFMSKRGLKVLFSKDYAISSTNLIDRFLVNRALNTSPDRLIVVNAENDYVTRDNRKFYTPEKLDSRNKGYFYQKTASESSVKVHITANRKQYRAGTEIARLIEGMGIKVLSVDEDTANSLHECIIRYSTQGKTIAALLHNYFPCKLVYAVDQNIIIDFKLDPELATLYL